MIPISQNIFIQYSKTLSRQKCKKNLKMNGGNSFENKAKLFMLADGYKIILRWKTKAIQRTGINNTA